MILHALQSPGPKEGHTTTRPGSAEEGIEEESKKLTNKGRGNYQNSPNHPPQQNSPTASGIPWPAITMQHTEKEKERRRGGRDYYPERETKDSASSPDQKGTAKLSYNNRECCR